MRNVLFFTMAVFMLLAFAAPARARPVPCVGRCDDGAGNGMMVENRCDDATERCEAGCDTTGSRPYPYARCGSKLASDGAGAAARDEPSSDRPR